MKTSNYSHPSPFWSKTLKTFFIFSFTSTRVAIMARNSSISIVPLLSCKILIDEHLRFAQFDNLSTASTDLIYLSHHHSQLLLCRKITQPPHDRTKLLNRKEQFSIFLNLLPNLSSDSPITIHIKLKESFLDLIYLLL